jgi:hypothetical protein
MKKLSILCFLLLSTSIVITAQIQIKNIDEDTIITISADNHFYVGRNGPIFLVKIDSVEFELADSSFSEINTEWIQSITVLKGSNSPANYDLYKGKDRIIITPLKSKEQEFYKWIIDTENRL